MTNEKCEMIYGKWLCKPTPPQAVLIDRVGLRSLHFFLLLLRFNFLDLCAGLAATVRSVTAFSVGAISKCALLLRGFLQQERLVTLRTGF